MQFIDICPPKAQKQCYPVDAVWFLSKGTLNAIVDGCANDDEAEVKVTLWTKNYVQQHMNKFKKIIEKKKNKKKKSTSEKKGMFRCIIIYKLFVCDFTYICI